LHRVRAARCHMQRDRRRHAASLAPVRRIPRQRHAAASHRHHFSPTRL